MSQEEVLTFDSCAVLNLMALGSRDCYLHLPSKEEPKPIDCKEKVVQKVRDRKRNQKGSKDLARGNLRKR